MKIYNIKINGESYEIVKDVDGFFIKPDFLVEGGSSLKPANEPICVARKPLSEKTIAENVLKWGTGGINIDGCRIDSFNNEHHRPTINKMGNFNNGVDKTWEPTNAEGRFPANIIFDESAAEMLDEQSGVSKSTKFVAKNTGYVSGSFTDDNKRGFNYDVDGGYVDSGGASRFFYIPKVGKKERNMGLDGFEEVGEKEGGRIDGKGGMSTWNTKRANSHPTVKPVQLMAYLCRLVTPPNGIVLDPFMGSGSTGISACLEGFRFVGMEMDEDYFKIAEGRITNYEMYREFLDKKKKKDTKKD